MNKINKKYASVRVNYLKILRNDTSSINLFFI